MAQRNRLKSQTARVLEPVQRWPRSIASGPACVRGVCVGFTDRTFNQFCMRCPDVRCAILFQVLESGGKWRTDVRRFNCSARLGNSSSHRTLQLLLEPRAPAPVEIALSMDSCCPPQNG